MRLRKNTFWSIFIFSSGDVAGSNSITVIMCELALKKVAKIGQTALAATWQSHPILQNNRVKALYEIVLTIDTHSYFHIHGMERITWSVHLM